MEECTLYGVFAPVPTPFYASGEIAWDKFIENIKQFGKTTLDGILVLGSNGEAVSLSELEKIKLISLAREHFPLEKIVLAGVGCESEYSTLTLCKEASLAEVDGVVVINPTYYRNTVSNPEVMLDYFLRVADQSPSPVLLYNIPRNTALNIPAWVSISASRHDNIIGIKDSSGDIIQLSTIIHDSAPGFSVIAGSASFLLPTLYMGGCGGTMAYANIAPDYCKAIIKAFHEGEHNKAKKLQMDILELNAAITSGFGITGLKYALDCLGYYGGPCRSPLPSTLSDKDKSTMQQLMKKVGLL